jgi:hypothetical protein
MAFDHEKFIQDRIAGRKMTMEDIAEHDTYAAIYALSMTPSIYKSLLALNTVEFSRLTTKVRAKTMEAFNKCKLNTGYLRAYPTEIAAVNKLREQVMSVYETSASSADFMIRNGEIDKDVVADLYEYKINGKLPEGKKKNASRKK